jgi:uncharacterized protein (TIRG00374 family)
MIKKVKSTLINLFKIGFAIGLIAWLVKSGKFDFSDLKNLLDFRVILVCAILVGISNFAVSERWRYILKSQGFQCGFLETFRLTFIGLFFNFAVPGGVGGDVIKGYYVAKTNKQKKFLSVFTIFLDRIIGLFGMSLMSFGAVLIDFNFIWGSPKLKIIALFIFFLLSAFCLFWTISFSKKIRHFYFTQRILKILPISDRFFQLWDAMLIFKKQKTAFLLALVFSFASQFSTILFFIFCGKWLGLEIPIFVYFVVVPIGFMITAIPISPAGIGVGQAAFLYLFNVFQGDQNNVGAVLISAFQIMLFIWSLIGAYFYLTTKADQSNNIQNQTI